MTAEEFSNQFDVLYNNITSNQAPGLNEYEKSVFLTKAQNEIVKNYFTANSKGNNIGQGFDDSAKRQADFSCLMKTMTCGSGSSGGSSSFAAYYFKPTGSSTFTSVSGLTFTQNGSTLSNIPANDGYPVLNNVFPLNGDNVTVAGLPSSNGTLRVESISYASANIDPRSQVFHYPGDVFIVINEKIGTSSNSLNINQVLPLRYDEYTRLMSKPYKRPLKNQAWRLINRGTSGDRYVEIITPPGVTASNYTVRYIRFPKPIITGNLDGLSIHNCYLQNTTGPSGSTGVAGGCELDPIIHEDILQRAVELAKVAWTATGQENLQPVMQAGQRSE